MRGTDKWVVWGLALVVLANLGGAQVSTLT